jgi:CPA1 family monovalent cation:H+ antiporter
VAEHRIPDQAVQPRPGVYYPHGDILTWGGLRGGISVAQALSLTANPSRNDCVTIIYTVGVFSISVKGLTINRVLEDSPDS